MTPTLASPEADLRALVAAIRGCTLRADALPHPPRPVVRLGPRARILITGQAPGARVHAAGAPFVDPSGERLRDWMGLDQAAFYDLDAVAVAPAGFCFPGTTPKGADRPPRPICARTWADRVKAALPGVRLHLIVGQYAIAHWLGASRRASLADTVRAYAAYGPESFPLPHPSWRTTAWRRRHPWFEAEVLPTLRTRVAEALAPERSASERS